jgi:hypothetical protein
MIPAEIITVLVAAARAAGEALPALLEALTDDGREAVLDALARDRDALDTVPSTTATIEAAIAEHTSRVRAHRQARAETVRGRYGLGDTARLALARAMQHAEGSETADLAAVTRLVDASLRGELVSVVPHSLDALPSKGT